MATTPHKANPPKKHGACDECPPGLRKVKCSGEQDGCSRCQDEGITCHYSDKKTMGRPRKRRRDGHSIQDDADADGVEDGEPAVDQLHVRYHPDPSPGNDFTPSTAPSLSNLSLDVPYTAAPDVPRALDPALASATDWDPVHGSDLRAYGIGADHLGSNGIGNGPNHLGIPEHYGTMSADMSNDPAPSDSCTCLTQLHMTLQAFQSMPPASFPSSRDPLTRAVKLVRSINRCTLCPLDFPTAMHTSMMVMTLLRLVVHGYTTLVRNIQAKAAEGRSTTYRVGEMNLAGAHLHTGTLDCPMGFNLELDAEEWSVMAKKVLKQDIYGNSQNVDCLVGAIEELEQRHQTWQVMELPFSDTQAAVRHRHAHAQDLFVQFIQHIRAVVEEIEL
ncbi:MAG: hypothetical protein Q9168_004171 [Polycauliona sp. 1 TL-2023]